MNVPSLLRPTLVARRLADVVLADLPPGVKGLILDIENCLAYPGTDVIPIENLRWVKNATREGYMLFLLTNMRSREKAASIVRQLQLPEAACLACGGHQLLLRGKPHRYGFRAACRQMGLLPGQIAVIGDQLLADILGGNRIKAAATVWVQPFMAGEHWLARVSRLLERLVLLQLPSPTRPAVFLPTAHQR
jgi:HAD superfamily phosphatase (TIGR01668 family)